LCHLALGISESFEKKNKKSDPSAFSAFSPNPGILPNGRMKTFGGNLLYEVSRNCLPVLVHLGLNTSRCGALRAATRQTPIPAEAGPTYLRMARLIS
jgi:hypothetical protein